MPDGVRHEDDGDTHGWLKVDPQFEDLLNPGNLNNEGGNLVFEVVCKFVPPKQADAKLARLAHTFASWERTFGIPITLSGWRFIP